MNEPNRSQTDQVDSARQQILALVREIEMLADAKVPPELFYPEYLKRVAMALGADAAAVWLFDDKQQFALKYYQQRGPLGIFEDPQRLSAYQKPLQDALQSGGVRVYRPGDPRVADAPTPHVLIMGALQQGTTPIGVLQILQRSEAPEEARAGYLQFVEQMCAFVPRFLRGRETPVATIDAGKELQDLRRVLIELHGGLSVAEVASVAANDGAKFLGCDRVGVVERYGTRYVVRAITGQESVNPRSNLVRLMARLTEQVLATGETLRYSGKPEGLAPQIEEPLAEFLDVSRSRLLTITPVMPREPAPGTESASAAAERRRDEEDAAWRVDRRAGDRQSSAARFRKSAGSPDRARGAGAGQRAGAPADSAVAGVEVRRETGRDAPGTPARTNRGGRRGCRNPARGAALVPWDYRVEGKGRVMPVVRQNVFAPLDGKVVEIHVDSGQHVEKGQLLLRLDNEDLRGRWLATSTELSDKTQQLVSLQSEASSQSSRNLPPEEIVRLSGKIAQTRIERDGATKRLEALTEQQKSLEIHAPISGVIATFQVAELLTNRPVRRGELLLEVMDETGPWRLELEVPEQRLGHILLGQEKLATEQLPVEYVLATATEDTLPARLESVATRSASSEDGGTVVEVFASLDSDQVPRQRRIGSQVTAKVNCGKRSLGYVLFGDVVEFVRKRLWL